MPVSNAEIYRILCDVMADKNDTRFAVRGVMQKHWYAFEYFHHRFLEKFSIEISSAALKIATAAGMSAAIGAATSGPLGAATAGVSGTVGTTVRLGLGALLSNALAKGKRQFKLHKGRQVFAGEPRFEQPAPHEDGSRLPPDAHYLEDTYSEFWDWPGYREYRKDDLTEDPLFYQLKDRIYFKPPKSGSRLNQLPFSYRSIFENVDDAEKQHIFGVVWEVSAFWPMLDYIFFYQGFYEEFEAFKNIPHVNEIEKFTHFLYSVRFYFLSRDFYLDHFMRNTLPTYEIMVTQADGHIIGTNLFENFCAVIGSRYALSKSISADPHETAALAGSIKGSFQKEKTLSHKVKIGNRIYLDIIKAFTQHWKNLPPQFLPIFQAFIKEIFFKYFFEIGEDVAAHSRVDGELAFSLKKNFDDYLACVNHLHMDAIEKERTKRQILKKRRAILRRIQYTDLQSARRQFPFDEVTGYLKKSGNPVEFLIHNLPKGLNLTHKIHDKPEDEMSDESDSSVYLSDSAVDGGLEGAFGFGTEMILRAFYTITETQTARVYPELRTAALNLLLLYGGIRILGGTVDFVYKLSEGTTILDAFELTSATTFIVSNALFGPNVINLFIAFGIQYGKDFLYTRMDQVCLSVVDSLVVQTDDKTTKHPPITKTQDPSHEYHDLVSDRTLPVGEAAGVARGLLMEFHLLQTAIVDCQLYAMNPVTKFDVDLNAWQLNVRSAPFSVPTDVMAYERLNFDAPRAPIFVDFPGFSLESRTNYLENFVLLMEEFSKIYHWVRQEKQKPGVTEKRCFDFLRTRQRTESLGGLVALIVDDEIESLEHLLKLQQAWMRAAKSTLKFLMLKQAYEQYIKHKQRKQVGEFINNWVEFMESMLEDKQSTNLNYDSLSAIRLRRQNIFMRGIYAQGVIIYHEWLLDLQHSVQIGLIPHRRDALMQLLQRPRLASDSAPTVQLVCAERLDGLKKQRYRDLQLCFLRYDKLNASDELSPRTFTTELIMAVNAAYVVREPIKPEPFCDYSHLNLSFKFTKDPRHFTSKEKRALYQDFGRVVRHLFCKSASSEQNFQKKLKLQKILEEIQKPTTHLNEKYIKDFIDAYVDYINSIHSTHLFLYYARVYQFIMESLRADFLKETSELRNRLTLQVLGGGVLAPELIEFYELLKALKTEEKFFPEAGSSASPLSLPA